MDTKTNILGMEYTIIIHDFDKDKELGILE